MHPGSMNLEDEYTRKLKGLGIPQNSIPEAMSMWRQQYTGTGKPAIPPPVANLPTNTPAPERLPMPNNVPRPVLAGLGTGMQNPAGFVPPRTNQGGNDVAQVHRMRQEPLGGNPNPRPLAGLRTPPNPRNNNPQQRRRTPMMGSRFMGN